MQEYTPLQRGIEQVQKTWQRVWWWTALGLGALSLAGVALLAGAVDLVAPLPGFLRLAVWALGALYVIAGLILLWLRRRRLSEVEAALLVERCYPDLRDRLVSAVQFGESSTEGLTGYMVERLIKETRSQVLPLNLRRAVVRTRLHRVALVGLGLVSLLILGDLTYPAVFQVEAGRILTPWRAIPPVQWTQIAVMPGDVEVLRGSDLTIAAAIEGQSAERALLRRRSIGGEWQEVGMERRAEDEFVYELFALQSAVEYQVSAGDGRSEVYRIAVYTLPELDDVSATYTYPAYTGRAPAVQRGSANIRAVVGTRVELAAHFSKALAAAALYPNKGDTLQAVEIDGGMALFRFDVVDSTSYHFRVEDVEGRGNDTSRVFALHALPDRPPQVKIPDPGGNAWALPVDIVPVAVVAEDDFGLGQLRFAYALDGGEERVLETVDFALPGEKTVPLSHSFALREMALEPGQVLAYYAEAVDWHSPPQRTRSDLHLIVVKAYQEKLAGIGGMCQGACQLLSQRQAALLQATWPLAAQPGVGIDETEGLAADQRDLRRDLGRLLASLDLVDYAEGATVSGAMERAEKYLHYGEAGEAVPPEQEALAGLLRLEMLLPKKLGSGGGGGEMSVATAELEEVVEDFAEKEEERRTALLRRARDLLKRTRRALDDQVAMNLSWSARGRAEAARREGTLSTDQSELAGETERLAGDIEALEEAVEVEQLASAAARRAATRMYEAAGNGRQQHFQRASARGIKAQVELERAVDALYPLMVRHAGQWLPIMAAALENLAQRQEELGRTSRAADGTAVHQQRVEALVQSQEVLPQSAAHLRQRLATAAEELESLVPALAEAATAAAKALVDSAVEEYMEEATVHLREQEFMRASTQQLHAAAVLHLIAEQLVKAQAGGAGGDLEQVAQALAATRNMRRSVQEGGGGKEAVEELAELYAPLEDAQLEEGLEALSAALSGRGVSGPTRATKPSKQALDALDGLIEALEARMLALAQLAQLAQLGQEGYPPAYRELVQQYYRRLASGGASR